MSTRDPAPQLDPAGVVLRFLESVGRPAEARFYLELFRSRPREQFAMIALDAPVLREAADAVVLDLRFLAALGLFPTVLVGLFQPAESDAQARRLRRRLAAMGVESESLPAEAVASPGSAAARIAGITERGAVPIVAFGRETGSSAADRFATLGALVGELRARKLVLLHRVGGLHVGGELVPLVNLTTDVGALLAGKRLSAKESAVLELLRDLLAGLAPAPVTAAITSPLSLLRELFTSKGAGTLLRRGASFRRHEGWDGVDRQRLEALVATSFGRPVLPAFFERPIALAFVEESYRAAALLQDTELGAYLTKFVVSPEARGEGLARDAWDALSADHPVVFWRARADNPIHDWYARLCDGLAKSGAWTVYWAGLAPERIPAAIAHALARPIDLG